VPYQHLDTLDAALRLEGNQLSDFKACLQAGATTLAERFAAHEPIDTLVRVRADFIDRVLTRAWERHMPADAEAALIAVGGYGRGELHPASDVDVLILTRDDPAALAEHLEALVMFLWDIGLEIGHSVRTLAQTVEEAEADVSVVTNLMESRLLAGDASLFSAMRTATGPDRIWPSDQFFAAKIEEQQARHRKFGDTAYNLEPNIKENPGGLRDIQMVGWVAKRHFGTDTMAGLVQHGFLTDGEYRALMAGQSLLWRIRFALHLHTGRHEDRLLFEHQRELALEFGYADDEHNLAVEQFMQAYYRTVMELNRLNEMLLQLFQEAILMAGEAEQITPINKRFRGRNGYLEVTNPGIFVRYPLALLEVFLVFQQQRALKGVRASTIRLIRAHLHLIDEHFRADIKARSLFMEILRQPSGLTHTLRRMNRYGVLARYIPAFGNIVGRMQHDLFHVYTVDEHTLTLIRNLRRFGVPAFAHEFPECSQVFGELPKPELLYLAGLFHDIAKGRGGDHSQLGAEYAWGFCKLHALSDYDTGLVSWLVRSHLLMSITAQRKDIEDPEVIQEFAAAVGDPNRLRYLYLLTVADIRATAPQLWNSWKNALLNQLYRATQRALERGLANPQAQDELIQRRRTEALQLLNERRIDEAQALALWQLLDTDYFMHATPDEIAWHTERVLSEGSRPAQPVVEVRPESHRGCTEIFVYSQDRDRLFAHTTGLLDQLGLDIQGARIQTLSDGRAMNSYFVLGHDGHSIVSPFECRQIMENLQQGLAHPDSFVIHNNPHIPRQIKAFITTPEVSFSQDESNSRTELHLTATDRPGLLSRIGQVFASHNISLISAKVATIGAIAEDTFLITDQNGEPLTDAKRKQALAKDLADALSLD
jgi:[protein-PII] uridylyltransferase